MVLQLIKLYRSVAIKFVLIICFIECRLRVESLKVSLTFEAIRSENVSEELQSPKVDFYEKNFVPKGLRS